MDFSHAKVEISRICREDHFFRISCGTDVEGLSRSLDQCGLINAPIVIERNGVLTIVSGFGRIAAAQKLGWSDISVRVLEPDTSLECCAQIALVDNTSQRSLNICEHVRAIVLLGGIVADLTRLTRWAQSCGLAVNPKVIADLHKIAQLPPVLETGLISGAIALPVAVRLADMQDRLTSEMLGLFLMELDLSLNRQRETLDWIEAIARRENLTTQQILEEEHLVRLRSDLRVDQRQKGMLIRQHLKTRRYPSISIAETEFETLRRKLQLPKSVQLTAPPGFESRHYCIQLQVADLHDLNEAQRELQRLAASSDLQSFLDTRNS
jgi:hypothetical protein